MKDFTDPLGPIKYFFPIIVGIFALLMVYEAWAWFTQYVPWARARFGYYQTISEIAHYHPWVGDLITLGIALFLVWWTIHQRTLH